MIPPSLPSPEAPNDRSATARAPERRSAAGFEALLAALSGTLGTPGSDPRSAAPRGLGTETAPEHEPRNAEHACPGCLPSGAARQDPPAFALPEAATPETPRALLRSPVFAESGATRPSHPRGAAPGPFALPELPAAAPAAGRATSDATAPGNPGPLPADLPAASDLALGRLHRSSTVGNALEEAPTRVVASAAERVAEPAPPPTGAQASALPGLPAAMPSAREVTDALATPRAAELATRSAELATRAARLAAEPTARPATPAARFAPAAARATAAAPSPAVVELERVEAERSEAAPAARLVVPPHAAAVRTPTEEGIPRLQPEAVRAPDLAHVPAPSPPPGVEAVAAAAAPAESVRAAPVAATAAPAPTHVRGIADQAVFLAEQGGGSARLQLRPPELGEVELVVRVRGRHVEVHVRTEEIGAQHAMLESRERLSDALAAKDFRMDEFRVTFSGNGSGDADASGRRGGRQASEPEPRPMPVAPAPEGRAANVPVAPPSFASGGVDLRV